MTLPGGYRLERATVAQTFAIAGQRGEMFVDMGVMTSAESVGNYAIWHEWLQEAIARDQYVGFLIYSLAPEVEIEMIVGGVGLMFHPKMPSASDPTTLKAYIMNMYVAPEYRRQGLAEALMHAALAEIRQRGLKSVSLHAAPLGKPLYERLGFIEASNPEMRLMLEEM